MHKLKKFLISCAKDILLPVACVYLICQFIICPVQVVGSSMYPTLVGSENSERFSGDYLLMIRKFIYNDYKQGDIVVASIPTYGNGKYLIKRVIATEGQEIDIDYDDSGVVRVFVDGTPLDEPYLNEDMVKVFYDSNQYPFTVPENSYFLMGDNRNNSLDSRNNTIGPVSKEHIIGKAILLAFPGEDSNTNKRDWDRVGSIYN